MLTNNVKKYAYNAKIKYIEDEIPDISNLATNTSLNAKINEIKKLGLTNLATTAALATVGNKILNIIDLVKKADYDVRNENKNFTNSDFNKFMSNILDAKIPQTNLAKEYDLNEKIKSLAAKEEIKAWATLAESKTEQDKIVKLQTCDLSDFLGQSYFNNDGAQL